MDKRCFIKALPNELLSMILRHADYRGSACFGLTCQPLYANHWYLHGLQSEAMTLRHGPEDWSGMAPLSLMIREWMGPEYNYCVQHSVFVLRSNWENHVETKQNEDDLCVNAR